MSKIMIYDKTVFCRMKEEQSLIKLELINLSNIKELAMIYWTLLIILDIV